MAQRSARTRPCVPCHCHCRARHTCVSSACESLGSLAERGQSLKHVLQRAVRQLVMKPAQHLDEHKEPEHSWQAVTETLVRNGGSLAWEAAQDPLGKKFHVDAKSLWNPRYAGSPEAKLSRKQTRLVVLGCAFAPRSRRPADPECVGQEPATFCVTPVKIPKAWKRHQASIRFSAHVAGW